MRKITLGIVCMTIMSIQSFSQSTYSKAIGIRLSGSYYDIASVSYKFFISEAGAIELNGGFGARNYSHTGGHYGAFALSAAASYQHHFDIKPVEGLRWFIGGGAIVYNVFSDDDQYEGFAFGLFPTGGVDYKFDNIPLNLSADLRPTFFLAMPNYYSTFQGTFGIAARYTIGQR
jgi:hypothetical protein